jgi:hypothetical protein
MAPKPVTTDIDEAPGSVANRCHTSFLGRNAPSLHCRLDVGAWSALIHAGTIEDRDLPALRRDLARLAAAGYGPDEQ